jgi:AcrR family transcriptional regulator
VPRPRLHDRDDSLDAALGVFHARGYGQASMRDLETAMDLRPGSIYASFGSKEQLFLEALDRYATAMKEEVGALIEDAPDPVEGLHRYLRALARAGSPGADPAQIRACMIVRTLLETAGRADDRAGARARQLLDQVERMLTHAVRDAQRRGLLRPEPSAPRIARLLQSQIVAYRTLSQRGLSAPARAALAEDIGLLLDGLRTPASVPDAAGG